MAAEVSTRYFCTECRRPYHPKHPPRMVKGEIIPCRDCREAKARALKLSAPSRYCFP